MRHNKGQPIMWRRKRKPSMTVYTCPGCKWVFVIGEGQVFGPIFENNDACAARLMPLEEFELGYSDCLPRT